jgi:hypothetical protein
MLVAGAILLVLVALRAEDVQDADTNHPKVE